MNELLSRMIARANQLGWLSQEDLATARELAHAGIDGEETLVQRGILQAGQLERLRAELVPEPADDDGALGDAVTVAATGAMAAAGTAGELAPGDQIGAYRITGKLGAGRMGIVYAAVNLQSDRTVALRVMRPLALGDAQAVARFEREAQAVAQLEHENIVRVHEVGREGEQLFFAMELLAGSPLDRVLMVSGALHHDRAARLALGVARGLAHAHARGTVHRDIKPSNVLVTPGAEGERPVVIDFGLPRHAGGAMPATRDQVIDAQVYMSPEQASGVISAAGPPTDVYSLGATLYEMLAGRPPFPGYGQIELLHRILREDPKPLGAITSGIPRDLETIVARAMEKEPQARYPSAAAMAADLEAFLEGWPIMARPIGWLGRLTRRARRNRAISATAGVASLLVIAVAAWSIAEKVEDHGRALQSEQAEREARLDALAERDRARERTRAQDEVLLAIRLRESGADPAVVMARFQSAEIEDPTYHGVFQQRGRYLLELGDVESAVAQLDRALRLEPADALSLFHAHQAHERLGSPQARLETLLDSLAISPSGNELSAWARARRLQASARGRQDAEAMVADLLAARAELDESICQAPRFVRALVDRATVASALGDHVAARRDLESAGKLAPDDPALLTGKAELHRVHEELHESIELCDRALYLQPHHAAARLVRARSELDLGLVRHARADIDAAIELGAGAEALATAVVIEIEGGDLERAGRRIAELYDAEGRTLRWLDHATRVAAQRGDVEISRKQAVEMTTMAPGDPRGWLRLARVALQRGEVETERTALATALELAPAWRRLGGELGTWQESLCLVALGDLARREGQHQDALELCDRAHRVGYHPIDHHFLELRIHLDLGELDAAAAAIAPLEHSSARAIDLVLARADLAIARGWSSLAETQLAKALERCPGAARLRRRLEEIAGPEVARELAPAPGDIDALIASARAALDRDDLEAATLAASDARRAAPEDWRPAWISGLLCEALDQVEEALDWYGRAIAREPGSAAPCLARGRLLYRSKRDDEALADLDRAVALEPSAEHLEARAQVHKRMRQSARAQADLDRALELEPGRASTLMYRGILLMELGHTERALADCEQAAKAGCTDSQLQLARVLCLRTLRRNREALEALTAFREAHPDYSSMELLELDVDELEDELRASGD